MTRGWFIAGTDTGVGKTLWSTALLAAFARAGHRAAGMKPVAAGGALDANGILANEDVLALEAAGNVAAPRADVNPWLLREAVSPHLAAAAEGVRIGIDPIVGAWTRLAAGADVVVVEGAGGWLAPIDETATMADVAAALGLPVVLVVGLRLGCLNHALLTASAIERWSLPLAGWVANAVDPAMERAADNIATLTQRLGAAPLAVIGHAPGAASLAAAADAATNELWRSTHIDA